MTRSTMDRPQTTTSRGGQQNRADSGRETGSNELRDSPMMAHLLDALEARQDVGHYGRLVFCMVARHFLEEDRIINLLAGQPDQDESKAQAMLDQVKDRNYCPPKRERILEWQAQQDFPICPTPDDGGTCNVYRELKFPEDVYDEIEEFYEERAAESR